MAEAINIHKQLAMGKSPEVRNSAKGSIPKYANGGAVMSEKGVATLPAKGVIPPLPKPGGKIATLKKGGVAVKPVRKAVARGR